MGLLAMTWGASYLFIKISLRDFSPAFIVFARTALAALVIVPVVVHRGRLRELRGHGRVLVAIAAIQVVVPFLLITFGQRWIATGLAGILIASAPIFTAALGMTAYAAAERPAPAALAGIVVGMVGVALLFGVDLSGSGQALAGGAMVLLAGLGYAIGSIELRRRLGSFDPAAVAASTMSISALMTLPLALADLPESAGADALAATAALGIVGTGVAFLVFYTLISEIGAGKASLVAYLAPGFAVGYGVLLLDERLTVATLVGLTFIVGGSWLGTGGKIPHRRGTVRPAAAVGVRPPG